MFESIISAAVAVITGGFVLTSRMNNKIDALDRRVDSVELTMARSYVTKDDFASTLERVEAHMIRIEDKLDDLVASQSNRSK
tara:strand:- start:1499 stop:1744 length:246 start_codon:yes stop_codon:yes gene_type:complete